MNGEPEWLKPLDEAAGTKRVLLVEGSRDEAALEKWLGLINPGFASRLVVRRAGAIALDRDFGGTERVKQGLKHRPNWRGLVDRDERTDPEIAEDQLQCPNLNFLPRYCSENYFIVPAEIWSCVPQSQREVHPGAEAAIRETIEVEVDRWVAHWSMWRTLRRREQEFRKALSFPNQVIEAILEKYPVAEADVKAMLVVWHAHFDPSEIYDEYDGLRNAAAMRTVDERLKHHIHGKQFFRQIVVPHALDRFGPKSADVWFKDLVASYPSVPDDLRSILEPILA